MIKEIQDGCQEEGKLYGEVLEEGFGYDAFNVGQVSIPDRFGGIGMPPYKNQMSF